MSTSSYEQVQDKVKKAIQRRGEFGIRDLSRTFKIYDDNGNRKLGKEELRKGLADYGLRLTQGEIDVIFSAYDVNGDSEIDFDEFLVALRGELSDARRQLVQRAFKKLDKTGDNFITIADIKGTYNARKHPKVESGEKTQDEVFERIP